MENKRSFLLVLVILFVVLLFLHTNIDYGEFGGDDVDYLVETYTRDFADWTTHWYNNWSGRVSVHTVMYLSNKAGIWFWRVVNPLFMLLLAYAAARVAFGPTMKNQEGPYFTVAFALLAIISNIILTHSALWMTGSYNYLWTVAAGLIAILPFTDSVFYHRLTRPQWFLFVAGLYAALGQEQIAIVVLLIIACAILILFLRKQLPWQMVLMFVLMTAGLVIMVTAPGSAIRLRAESTNWFPGFLEFSILDKAKIGIEFLFTAIISYNVSLLIIFFALLVYGVHCSSLSKIFKIGITTFFVIACLLLVISLNPQENINLVFINFEHLIEYSEDAKTVHTNFNRDFLHTAFSMAFWGSVLFICVPLSIFFMSRADRFAQIFNLLLYACALLSLAAMALSPTMYASGGRVSYVFAILLVILILRLLAQAIPSSLLHPFLVQIQPVNMIVAVVFLLAYYLILNNHSLSSPVEITGVLQQQQQMRCGASKVELENHYFLLMEGWTAVPGPASEERKQVILLKPVSSDDVHAYLVTNLDPPGDLDSLDVEAYSPVGFEGKANFYNIPKGEYQIGLGIIDDDAQLSSVCYLDQTLINQEKWKAAIQE